MTTTTIRQDSNPDRILLKRREKYTAISNGRGIDDYIDCYHSSLRLRETVNTWRAGADLQLMSTAAAREFGCREELGYI